MQIELKCPHCASVIQTEAMNQGKVIQCNSCAGDVQVGLLRSNLPPILPRATPPPPIPASQIPIRGLICVDCGEVGDGKCQGSGAVELALYFFAFAPGIAYSAWRGTNKVCTECGGKLLNPLSPRGKELARGRFVLPPDKSGYLAAKIVFGLVALLVICLSARECSKLDQGKTTPAQRRNIEERAKELRAAGSISEANEQAATRKAEVERVEKVETERTTAKAQKESAANASLLKFQTEQAINGLPSFQYDLALRYLEGRGVDKDEATGIDWLKKSAAGGNGLAERKLGELRGK